MSRPWDTGLDRVLRAAHARLSRDLDARSFTVALDPDERRAYADLLGLESDPPATVKVRIDGPVGLARAVEETTGRSLVEEVGVRYGPLVDPAEARQAERAAKAGLWRWWLGQELFAERPALADWARRVGRTGVRTDDPRALLEDAVAVLRELPAADELLPVLAGRLVHDTHALDPRTPLSTLVLGAVAAEQGVERPEDAAGRRALWRSVGVRDDELSSTVLVAGLRPEGESTGARLCRWGADAGEVVALTLAQVRGGAGSWHADVVHVVENPAIIAMATDELGSAVPPVVCTSGWPSGAVAALLGDLAGAGARLRYHGDLDGEGLRIAASLVAMHGVEPWRMTREDYLAHVPSRGASVGDVTDVDWDPGLGAALRQHGVAVLEENVWSSLAVDLRRLVP